MPELSRTDGSRGGNAPRARWAIFVIAAALAGELRAAPPSDEAALRGLNDDYMRAYLACDAGKFRELLAEDFVCSLADGAVLDKAHFLEMAALPPKVSDFRNDRVAVRLGPGAGVVEGRVLYRSPEGRAIETRYRYLCVKRAGRWLIVSAQLSRGANP